MKVDISKQARNFKRPFFNSNFFYQNIELLEKFKLNSNIIKLSKLSRFLNFIHSKISITKCQIVTIEKIQLFFFLTKLTLYLFYIKILYHIANSIIKYL